MCLNSLNNNLNSTDGSNCLTNINKWTVRSNSGGVRNRFVYSRFNSRRKRNSKLRDLTCGSWGSDIALMCVCVVIITVVVTIICFTLHTAKKGLNTCLIESENKLLNEVAKMNTWGLHIRGTTLCYTLIYSM